MNDNNRSKFDRVMQNAKLIEEQASKAVRPFREDGYVNLVNRYGTAKDMTEQYRYVQEPAVPDELLTMFYEGNGLFAKIIDAPAEEAVKHGFKLAGISDPDLEKFYISALDELDWEETASTCLKWARLFGGSLAVMLINDGGKLEDPIRWDRIKSIDDIRVFDRSVIQPDYSSMFSYDPRDPFRTRGSRLGMPEYYHIFSKYGSFTVHDSRVLTFRNGVLPENTSNSIYELWGMPEYVRIKRAIRDAELAHASGPKMLDRSVQPVYKMKDLAMELQSEEGETNVLKRLQAIDMARGIMNSLVIDSEGEDYDFKQFQYSGVADVVNSACNFLSAITNIPQTILFGRSPAGMNATGESDLENWYSYVARTQKRNLKGNLRYLLSIIFQAGLYTKEVKEVPEINIEFNPLWTLSDLQIADLELKREQAKKTRAETTQLYIDMQVIDPSEVRKNLAKEDEYDIESVLDDIPEEELMDIFEQEAPLDAPPEVGGESKASGDTPNFLTKDFLKNYAKNGNAKSEPEADPDGGNAPDAAPEATKLPQDMDDQAPANERKVVKQDSSSNPTMEESHGSVGVLVVSDGKVLSGTRHNDFGYGLICGPGGHVEAGETAEQAAIRETQEEFGITPKNLIHLGKGPVEQDTKLTPDLFLCLEWEGEPSCDDLEMVNPQFRTLEEIDQLKPSLFQPFADGLNVLLEKVKPSRDDGGSGSGNHGHAGVLGKVGGSAPSGKSLSEAMSNALASEDEDYIRSTLKSSMKKMPTGSSFSSYGVKVTKTGENDWEITDPWGDKSKAKSDEIEESFMDLFMDSDDILEVEFDIPDSDDIGKAKIAAGELKPSETSVDTVLASVNSPSDLRKLNDDQKRQLKEELEAEHPDYGLTLNGTLENSSMKDLGYNETPDIMDSDEFNRYVKENNCKLMWRGVQDYVIEDDEVLATAGDIEKDFMLNDTDPVLGGGNYGSGYHFSTEKNYAEGFGRKTADTDGRVFECALKPDAKIISLSDAKAGGERLGVSQSMYAMLSGYDAITGGTHVYNILNRKALVMKKPSRADSVDFSEKPLDFSADQVTIKSKDNLDGAPYGNKNAAGPHQGKGKQGHKLSAQERKKIGDRLIGQKSSKGTVVTGVSTHAFDRLGGRSMSVGRVEKMLASSDTKSDKNHPDRTLYDIPGSRLVLADDGEIVSVMWRKK